MQNTQRRWTNRSRFWSWVVAFCVMGGAWSLVPSNADAKKRRTRYHFRKGGHLFVAQKPFPTSAEDLKGFVKLGRKHRQKRMDWRKDSDLSLHILLVLRRAYRTRGVNLVLYQKGKKGHVDSQLIPVQKGKLQLFASPLTFSNSSLQRGKKYELRATVVRRRGRTFHVTVLARTFFRL